MKTLILHHISPERQFVVYRSNLPNCYVNEAVQLQNLHRKDIGTGRIVKLERVSLWDKSQYNVPKITERDAINAGFDNIGHMRRVFGKRTDGITVPLYKITVRRDS